MKSITTFLIFILSLSSIHSQTQVIEPVPGCDYAINEKDEFTGNSVLFMESEALAIFDVSGVRYPKGDGFFKVMAAMSIFKGHTMLVIEYIIDKRSALSDFGYAKSGSSFFFKLQNGEISELVLLKDSWPEYSKSSGRSHIVTTYIISDEQLDQILSSPIEKIRLSLSKTQDDTGSVNPNLLIDQAKCLKLR